VTTADQTAPVAGTGWVAARLGTPTEALEIRNVEVGPPGPNQVRVATKAFCLDFNDIDTIHGRYGLLKFDPPFVVGMAASGVVDAAGPGAEALLGQRVVGCTVGVQGGYASAALLDTATVQSLPSWLSFVDGVAMFFPYLLGWLALRERGRVQAGDVVLVHAAAGGIGSGVVQLAKAFGATVIATAGSEAKVDLCLELGADYAVNYRTNDFVAYVADVTNGRGVDVAFDTVGGQVTTDTFRAMAFNGRHLIVGFSADIAVEEHPVSLQPSIYGNFDLVGICFAFVDSPRTTRPFGMNFLSTADGIRIWGNILQMARQGKIRPVVGQEIEFEDVPRALEAIERRETTGRSVVRITRNAAAD
jgi:NADPH2:quinone reductase